MSNVLENNADIMSENKQNNNGSTDSTGNGNSDVLFKESHTPTELETDDSRITTPKESRKNNRATPIKKANTKEVVFLEEEEDESSQSESSSDTEKHDFEPEASVSPELEIVHLEQPSPETNKEGASDLEVATISPDIDDYDLEDAERYFNRQNGTIVCRYCGKTGHKSRDCPEYASSNACFLCGEVDHNARSCPMLVCRHCHKPGHNSASCPEQRVPGFCRYCSSRLHKPENCPIIPRPCDKSMFQFVHCVCCGKLGHLLCKRPPTLLGSRGGKCAICGSRDHYYMQCGDRNAHRTIHSGDSEAKQGACFICGQYGHFAAECPEKKRQDTPRLFSAQRRIPLKRQSSQKGGYAKKIRE